MRKLFKLQEETIKRVIMNNYLGIFNECGTGKTYTMLYVMQLLKQKFLVVTPLTVMDWWIEEGQSLGLKIFKIYGNKQEKNNIISQKCENADGFVINYDSLRTLVTFEGSKIVENKLIPFIDMNDIKILICDESTYFKHRNKRFKVLQNIMWKFNRRYILTGTPVTNSLLDLWPQIYILDGGYRLGRSWTSYLNSFFYCANRFIWKYEPYQWSEQKISELIKDIEVRYKLSDITEQELPEGIIYEYKYINPKEEVIKIYKKILKECIIRIEKQGVTALSGGAMFQKLLEISSGFVYDDNNNTIVIDDLKMRTIVECIQNELCNKQVVIFYNFNGEAEILKRFLSSYRHISSQTSEKERSEIISEFKSRLFNILLAHSRTMGIGVNLQNAYAIIWVSPPTSLETFQQANARVYRSGYQGKKVPCFLFTTNQLLDKKVYKALQNKEQVQKKFLELIKNSI